MTQHCRKIKLFRVHEAVRYLDDAITEGTMRQWIFHRRIDTVRVGGRVLVPQDALDNLVAAGRTTARKVGE